MSASETVVLDKLVRKTSQIIWQLPTYTHCELCVGLGFLRTSTV